MTTSVTPDTPATRPDRDDAYVTRLELVNRLALLAASSLDLPAVLKTITQELRAAFSSYSVSIAMIDGDMLAFQATDSIYGFWDAEHLKTRRHRRDGPSGMARALRKGSLLHIPDAAQDPQHTPSPVLPLARCELATPLIAGDEMVGGITALGDRPHFFSPADERLMTAVAPHAASAIRNALAHTAAQRSLAQLEAIQQTSAAIASELDQSPLLQQLVTRAMQLLGGSSGGIYLWDADAEVLRLESAASPLNVGAVLRPGEGASGVAFQTGQPLNIPDYRAWPGHSPVFESSQLRSVIAVPLNYRQETIGVLTVSHNAESNRYSDADMRLLALFANQAAVAITNARLFQETRGQTQEISRLYAQAQHILRQMRFFNGVTRGLSLEAPLDTVLQAVADRIQQAFNYPYVDIALINADDDSLSYRASSSSQPGYTLEIIRYRLPLDESRITA